MLTCKHAVPDNGFAPWRFDHHIVGARQLKATVP